MSRHSKRLAASKTSPQYCFDSVEDSAETYDFRKEDAFELSTTHCKFWVTVQLEEESDDSSAEDSSDEDSSAQTSDSGDDSKHKDCDDSNAPIDDSTAENNDCIEDENESTDSDHSSEEGDSSSDEGDSSSEEGDSRSDSGTEERESAEDGSNDYGFDRFVEEEKKDIVSEKRITLRSAFPPMYCANGFVACVVTPTAGYGRRFCLPLLSICEGFESAEHWHRFEKWNTEFAQFRRENEKHAILQIIAQTKVKKTFGHLLGAWLLMEHLDATQHPDAWLGVVKSTDDFEDHTCALGSFLCVEIRHMHATDDGVDTLRGYDNGWVSHNQFRLLLTKDDAKQYRGDRRALALATKWKRSDALALEYKLLAANEQGSLQSRLQHSLRTAANQMFSRNLRRTRANKRDEIPMGFASAEDWETWNQWLSHAYGLTINGTGKTQVVVFGDADCDPVFGRGFKKVTSAGGHFRISDVKLVWVSKSTTLKLKCKSIYVNADGLTA